MRCIRKRHGRPGRENHAQDARATSKHSPRSFVHADVFNYTLEVLLIVKVFAHQFNQAP